MYKSRDDYLKMCTLTELGRKTSFSNSVETVNKQWAIFLQGTTGRAFCNYF